MTFEINNLFKGAKNNQTFRKELEAADNNKMSFFISDLEKHIWASFYYGWLVGKYKDNWKNHINDKL